MNNIFLEEEPTWAELMEVIDDMFSNMSEAEIEDWMEGE